MEKLLAWQSLLPFFFFFFTFYEEYMEVREIKQFKKDNSTLDIIFSYFAERFIIFLFILYASALTRFIKYIHCRNLQFLNY